MTPDWLTFDQAAKKFGYNSKALPRRIRQLRELGYVSDIGNPPAEYAKLKNTGQVVILWANPKAAMIKSDAPEELFKPGAGRRHEPIQPAKKRKINKIT